MARYARVIREIFAELRHTGFLAGLSAVSLLTFLGASVEPVVARHSVTLATARAWTARYDAIPHPAHSPAPTSLADQPSGNAAENATLAESRPAGPPTPFSFRLDPLPEQSVPETADAEWSAATRDTLEASFTGADAAFLRPPDDSLDFPPSDSTNRARFLPRQPRPGRVTSPFPPRVSPLYLQPGTGVQRTVEFDSARGVVMIHERLNGQDIRIPYEMSIEEYIQGRYNYERERRTAAQAAKVRKEDEDKLAALMKDITEIDIPVAPNPLMSIFGDRSRISVRINGSIGINAGFRIESSDQQSVYMSQTQFAPNFKQQVQVNVNGLVGDKLSIRADWSTERAFDYENQLKIKYTGYEDEIIQSIEAGNVSLQTPATLIQGSGALFGIKAEFQMGPLRLAAIASQKKGESSRMSVSGGSQEQKFERHAYDYTDSHYFVDIAYRENDNNGRNVYESYYNYRAEGATAPLILRPDLYIKDIEVWISRPASTGATTNPDEREVVAFIDNPDFYSPGDPDFPASYLPYLDPNTRIDPQSGEVEVGLFKRLKRDTDFRYDAITGIVTLNQSIQEDQAIAVAYRVEWASKDQTDDHVYGVFSGDARLNLHSYTDANNLPVPARMVLKLVKPKNLGPSFTKAWPLKVRSIFSLNTRNIRPEDLASFKFVFRAGGQPETDILPKVNADLLRIFGLDYTDEAGGGPDGKIDYLAGETIDAQRGELICPTLEPWNSGMAGIFAQLYGQPAGNISEFLYPEAYSQTKTVARQSLKDKIVLVGTTRGTSSAVYNLGFNVVPGSVRVLLNGTPLTPGVDYSVDEQVGSVRITKEEALQPGARVDIDYERQDLFSFASKTLLGARGEVTLNKDSYFGFTYMGLNQKTLSDKVRIGEEPINNQMIGIDGATSIDMPVITDALNSLPFLSTKEKSSLTVRGEAAMIIPDANTKVSTMPTDDGAGIAYIDDFEGARVFIPLQTAYSIWKPGTIPPVLPTNPGGSDSVMNSFRAKLNWYNVPTTTTSEKTVTVSEIWPNKSVAREDQRVTVLDLDYYPDRHGMFNYSPRISERETQNWASIVRMLPVNATNLVDGNFNYLEIWMKVEGSDGRNPDLTTGKLLIDIGKVSEEVIPNGKLDTEDDVIPGSIRNGILNPGEDVGLDMLTNAEEQQKYGAEISAGLLDGNDPSGDNFNYNVADWNQFNGSEGNINDPAGQFPDTEDLNNNGVLDLANDYFRYAIDLDTLRFNPLNPADRNPYIVGGGANGWYQFRIPLNEQTREIFGNPALDNVEFLRLTLTGLSTVDPNVPVNLRIADFNFVGNQWYEEKRNDPYFAVAVVNIEDNPGYDSPPGVIRPRDRTRPDQEIYGNEQSLSLDFTELPPDSLRGAYRVFSGNGLDLFNYRNLKMFVHGDDNIAAGETELVMRFGIDSVNYYEYRAPITPGWADVNEVDINFADLTAIKGLIDSTSTETSFPVPGKPAGYYFWMVGQPDVVRVERIAIGVRNRSTRALTGRVWVNELRVIVPNTQNGYAYSASGNFRLADIADVSANVNHSDPWFHSLAERFSATRSTINNWNLSTTLNIDRAFPQSWKGTQIRVSYNHSENLSKPLLMPSLPDVEVDAYLRALAQSMAADGATQREIDDAVHNAELATQTLEVRDSWIIPNLRFKAPGESWLVQDIFNRLEFGYNYSIARARDPLFQSRRHWQWQFRTGYSYDFGREAFVMPFRRFDGIPVLEAWSDAKWYFLPTRIGADLSAERSRIEEQDRNPPRTRPYTRTFSASRGANFSWTLSEGSLLNLNFSYSTNLRSSLVGLETEVVYDGNGNPVTVQRQSSAIFHDIFWGDGSLNLGDPTAYSQQVSFGSRPLLPAILSLDKLVDLSFTYQTNYQWAANLQQGTVGQTAGYNASINGQMNIKLKSMFDPLFDNRKTAPSSPGTSPRGGRGGDRKSQPDEDNTPPTSETLPQPQPQPTSRPDAPPLETLKSMPVTMLVHELERMGREVNAEEIEKLRSLEEKENQLREMKNRGMEADPEEVVKLYEEVQAGRDRAIAIIRGEQPQSQPAAPGAPPAKPASTFDLSGLFSDIVYYGVKVPFLDFDNIGITFTETNTSAVGGVVGATGFTTFWSSAPFSSTSDPSGGPSRLYQLGLISDPNPLSGTLGFQSQFPFVGIKNYQRGFRAPTKTGTYVDNYAQANSFSVKTNRPLWENARLDLNWDLRWSINKNFQIQTPDSTGLQVITGMTTTGTIERSYLMMPDMLLFGFFNTNMEHVNDVYSKLLADPADTRSESEKLAQAFEEGFEAIPWLSSILGSYFPRVNWGFRWDGLEKWSLLSGLADRIALEHRYSSAFATGYRMSPDNGLRITESERAGYNFSPLLGLSLGFTKFAGGDLNVTARWGKQGTYDLSSSSSNITQSTVDEVSLTANLRRNGFELPLFGVALKNDIDFSLAVSVAKNSSRVYAITELGTAATPEGQPREGTTRTTIEPRVKYSISQRVQASLFYRYQRTKPDAEVGSRIPGSTIHEGGLEVRITIAGS